MSGLRFLIITWCSLTDGAQKWLQGISLNGAGVIMTSSLNTSMLTGNRPHLNTLKLTDLLSTLAKPAGSSTMAAAWQTPAPGAAHMHAPHAESLITGSISTRISMLARQVVVLKPSPLT